MLHDRLRTVSSTRAVPGDPSPVPQVLAAYATYLRARARAEPEVTVTGDTAEIAITTAGKSLVVTFDCRRAKWSLTSAHVRDGEQETEFASGRLAEAVTMLFMSP